MPAGFTRPLPCGAKMVLPAAAIHPLTPGSPVYAVAKIAAVGGLFALRFAMGRRNRDREEAQAEPTAGDAPPVAAPHPVSRRKQRRRKRRS